MLLCDICDAGWHLYCLPVSSPDTSEGTLF
jgi:hypothetical protein